MNSRRILYSVLFALCILTLSACDVQKNKEIAVSPAVEDVQVEETEEFETEEVQMVENEVPEVVMPQTEQKEISKEYYYYASILIDILDNPNLHVNVLTDYGIYCQVPAEFAFADIDSDLEQELLVKSMTSGYVEDAIWDIISVYKYSDNLGIEPSFQYVGDVTFYNGNSVLISFADLYTKDDDGVLVESDHIEIEFYEMSNLTETFTIGKDAMSAEAGEALIKELTVGKQEIDLSWKIISMENIMNAVNAEFKNGDFLDDKYNLTNYIRFMSREMNAEIGLSVDHFVRHCIYQGIVNDGYEVNKLLRDMIPSIRLFDESDDIVYRVRFDAMVELSERLYAIESFDEYDLDGVNLKEIGENSIEGVCTLVGNGISYELYLFEYSKENGNIVIKGICHCSDEGILSDYFECTLQKNNNGVLDGYDVIDFTSEPLWQKLI